MSSLLEKLPLENAVKMTAPKQCKTIKGTISGALAEIEKIELYSNHHAPKQVVFMPDSKKLDAIEILRQQNPETALKEYETLMQKDEKSYDAWVNYASFLYRCGRYEQALKTAEKSINLQPSAEGFHNIAAALEKTGENSRAIKAYKEALRLNPDFIQSQNSLAMLYEKTGALDKAIYHFRIAALLAPETPLYWQNLARAYLNKDKGQESLQTLRLAYNAAQDKTEILQKYAELFDKTQTLDIDERLIKEALECMDTPSIEKSLLTKILRKIYLYQHVVIKFTPKGSLLNTKNFEDILDSKDVVWSSLSELDFISILAQFPIHDDTIEARLTTLRKFCLEHITQDNSGKSLWDKALLFLTALACQNFFNEFVFFETPDEKKKITALENRITEGQNLTLYDITIYACYRPLHKLPRAHDLMKKLSTVPILENLVRIQLTEPLEEENIKPSIKNLTSIDNAISNIVKQQYEENPYPRWNILGNSGSMPFQGILQFLLPHLEDYRFSHINKEKTKTLIAGCGTGKQVINTAQIYKNSDILAVDLSAASIAYAIRKTREYGLNNVEYGIADILKLEELEQKFDVIQCGGVLHHMEDPEKGWNVLNNCLKPGGFMLIALYSKAARKSITDARDFIKYHKYASDIDSIRTCRHAIKNLPESDPVKKVAARPDFFSSSTCRDLIFHVQETYYTALEIKDILERLNLEFLGFHLHHPDTLNRYRLHFPDDPNGLNLENWHEFEQIYPQTFNSMFRFWLQKPA